MSPVRRSGWGKEREDSSVRWNFWIIDLVRNRLISSWQENGLRSGSSSESEFSLLWKEESKPRWRFFSIINTSRCGESELGTGFLKRKHVRYCYYKFLIYIQFCSYILLVLDATLINRDIGSLTLCSYVSGWWSVTSTKVWLMTPSIA